MNGSEARGCNCPYVVRRDAMCSCEAYGMRPTYQEFVCLCVCAFPCVFGMAGRVLPPCQILREFQRPVGAHSKRALGADGPGGAAVSSSPPGRGRYALSCFIGIAAVSPQRRSLQRFPVYLVMSNVCDGLGMLASASLPDVLGTSFLTLWCACAHVCCV